MGVHGGADEGGWEHDAASEFTSALVTEVVSEAGTGDGAIGTGERADRLSGASRATEGFGMTPKARTPSSFSGTFQQCKAISGLTAPLLLVLDSELC